MPRKGFRVTCSDSDDIGTELGIDKCATLALKRGKITKFEGISLPEWKSHEGIN